MVTLKKMSNYSEVDRLARSIKLVKLILTKHLENQALRDEGPHGIEFDLEDVLSILDNILDELDNFENYDLG